MPQALESQREIARKWFGSIDDSGPSSFLAARGWTERGGMIFKPTPSHTPSIYEVECLLFLRDEWDYDFERPLFESLPHETLKGDF